MIRKALLFVLLLPLVSCGWNHLCTRSTSYNLGEEKATVVGSEMVQIGCFAAKWDPRGLNQALLKRCSQNDDSFVPCVEKELIYSGREGDILHITYREYTQRGSYARTPFFQQVYYDLKKSDKIMFQDWVLRVIDANNELIRFKVVNEPQREYLSCMDYR